MTDSDCTSDLVYYRCPECDAVGYLPRDFCPRCGNAQREPCRARGVGTVTAATVLGQGKPGSGPPASGICLVAFDEGFFAMARSPLPLNAGARVSIIRLDDRIPIVRTAEDRDPL